MQLNNKAAVVTESARGIDYAIALAFLAKGARVMQEDRGRPALTEAKASLGKLALGRVAFLVTDVPSSIDCARMITEAGARFGATAILVCNARIACPAVPIEDITV